MSKKLFTRAQFRPDTLNEESRTVDVVFATSTPVKRYSWYREEYYSEVLNMDGANLSRAERGLPVLDNHRSWGAASENVVGRAENIRKENDVWVATIRFAKDEEATKLQNKVRDGIITDISFGYSIDEVVLKDKEEGKIREYDVTKWTPMEISFVTIPADPRAGVRSESDLDIPEMIGDARERSEKPSKNTNPEIEMKREKMIAYLTKRSISVKADATDEEVQSQFERALESDTSADADALRSEAASEAVKAERSRVKTITEAVRKAGLPAEEAERMIEEGLSVDAARAEIIDKWEANDPHKGSRGNAGENGEDQARRIAEEGLFVRLNRGAIKDVPAEIQEKVRKEEAKSLLRMAEDSLTRSGLNVRDWSPSEIAKAAMGVAGIGERGYNATSDFPILLNSVINRTLLRAYEYRQPTFEPFVRRDTLPDFRSVTRARISDFIGNLELIPEGGEYKDTTVVEGGETYKLAKYGRKFSITWEAIVNDDLGAFTRVFQMFGNKVKQLESKLIYNDILLANPIMDTDGTALFDEANHKNFTDTGTALSETSLDAAFQLVQNQKGENGDFLNLMPKFLLVGPKNAVAAYKLTSSNFVPDSQSSVSIPKFTGLQVIEDPRITDYAWFLICDPMEIDTIELSSLRGEPMLYVESKVDFDIDGMVVKARAVRGAKAIDYRSMYKNDGEAPQS